MIGTTSSTTGTYRISNSSLRPALPRHSEIDQPGYTTQVSVVVYARLVTSLTRDGIFVSRSIERDLRTVTRFAIGKSMVHRLAAAFLGTAVSCWRLNERGKAVSIYTFSTVIGSRPGTYRRRLLNGRPGDGWSYAPLLLERKAERIGRSMDVEKMPYREIRTVFESQDHRRRTIMAKSLSRPFALFAPRAMYKIYVHFKNKNGGVAKPEFRLPTVVPESVLLPIGCSIGIALVGAGIILSFQCIQAYIVDCFTLHMMLLPGDTILGVVAIVIGCPAYVFVLLPSVVTLHDYDPDPVYFGITGSRYGTAVDMHGDNARQMSSDRSKAWIAITHEL
ncbi:uncharacterized protein HD556DRAFT_1302226 [Suillus plorans]|uniref:Uncharacterized protein n=1 Tax=Suillus plorans TaxID=116603 RepID=A0A9P7E331_9AGAM|nr:uncharacterized protein HD556DRAFT_1302226 [Suillus plorans]KAG1809799.1 hypothetical protein HD556DRAFT_1302226 [Suillus plorans]